jgi:hypothetical protein
MSELTHKEGRLLLAQNALNSNQIRSQSNAARVYSVPRTTLQDRMNGTRPKAESNAIKQKLKPDEHEALINWCLDIDKRGFPPQLIHIGEMANSLLAARNTTNSPLTIGKC